MYRPFRIVCRILCKWRGWSFAKANNSIPYTFRLWSGVCHCHKEGEANKEDNLLLTVSQLIVEGVAHGSTVLCQENWSAPAAATGSRHTLNTFKLTAHELGWSTVDGCRWHCWHCCPCCAWSEASIATLFRINCWWSTSPRSPSTSSLIAAIAQSLFFNI